MARPRNKPVSDFTPGQASYVLNRLMQDRRISASDVNRYVSDMSREIDDLEKKLAALRAAHGAGSTPSAAPARRGRRPGRPAAAAAAPAAKASAKGGRRRGRKSAITPEQVASRKLQGRYLGLVRQFPPNKRAYFAKVARDKGREAAIKEMLDTRK